MTTLCSFETPQPEAATSAPDLPAVLLVDDDECIRDLTSQLLKLSGYMVFEAGSGAQAVNVWGEHAERISVVLTDINLGNGIDGPTLARTLRVMRPDLPIVFTSGGGKGAVTRCDKFHYLQKPYSRALLRSTLSEAVAA